MVTWRTTKFNIQQLYALPAMCVCFVFIWEQTATSATYSINWLVFIAEMKSVYSAVRTGSLNKAVWASSLEVNIATTVCSAHTVFTCFVFIWEQTATCATYSINWLDFIIEMKSVYSAVRNESLNKAVCASSLKGQYRYCRLEMSSPFKPRTLY